jgi:hypothetical protein
MFASPASSQAVVSPAPSHGAGLALVSASQLPPRSPPNVHHNGTTTPPLANNVRAASAALAKNHYEQHLYPQQYQGMHHPSLNVFQI